MGLGTDVSNEIFVEDAYVDTTFLERRLVGSPEARWAATDVLTFEGVSRPGGLRYRIQQDASVGDLMQRGALGGYIEIPAGLSDSWRIAPRLEYRHDRTFERDLTQWQGELAGRHRRVWADGATTSDLSAATEFTRASGLGSVFVPDRWGARLRASVGAMPLAGAEWQLGYGLAARSFPDSTTRDHYEHSLDARWRTQSDAGHSLVMELEADRRSAIHGVPTSRDRFADGRGALEVTARTGGDWACQARGEIEIMRYDAADSSLYFDYRVSRARVTPRLERPTWSLAIGPRAEWMVAARAPAEEYIEWAGLVELEAFPGTSWWTLSPAAGWRGYGVESAPDLAVLHSSYSFLEVALMLDQPLTASVRLRGSGLGRIEWHRDPSQDARSLYFSLELRRLL